MSPARPRNGGVPPAALLDSGSILKERLERTRLAFPREARIPWEGHPLPPVPAPSRRVPASRTGPRPPSVEISRRGPSPASMSLGDNRARKGTRHRSLGGALGCACNRKWRCGSRWPWMASSGGPYPTPSFTASFGSCRLQGVGPSWSMLQASTRRALSGGSRNSATSLRSSPSPATPCPETVSGSFGSAPGSSLPLDLPRVVGLRGTRHRPTAHWLPSTWLTGRQEPSAGSRTRNR